MATLLCNSKKRNCSRGIGQGQGGTVVEVLVVTATRRVVGATGIITNPLRGSTSTRGEAEAMSAQLVGGEEKVAGEEGGRKKEVERKEKEGVTMKKRKFE